MTSTTDAMFDSLVLLLVMASSILALFLVANHWLDGAAAALSSNYNCCKVSWSVSFVPFRVSVLF